MPPKPEHIAIIMDGNGRWAERVGLPRLEGHRRGVEALRQTIEGAIEHGIGYLTVFSFSSENWSRPAAEISDLMGLLRRFIRRDLADLHKNNVRIRIAGARDDVEQDIVRLLDEAEATTRGNTGLNLQIAFNYGSRAEITSACRLLAEEVLRGELRPEAIDQSLFASRLSTAGIPDPDLLIRTSGELRLSNFLLWQLAYAELLFVDTCWPEFGKANLTAAIEAFQARDRRYGGRPARQANS